MKRPIRLAVVVVLAGGILGPTGAAEAQQWPQFRGPGGQGHSDAVGLPVRWSESQNVAWKTPIPGRGWSSPVIEGDRIWMTAAIETEATEEQIRQRLAQERDSQGLTVAASVSLRAVCVDRRSGKQLHDVELIHVSKPELINETNSYASPTPVIEAGRLYCHFGTYGTACLDTDTLDVVWKNEEAALKLDHQTGPGGSPVLWRDRLIFHGDGRDVQFVAALDKNTGRIAWKTGRSGKLSDVTAFRKAFVTPLVLDRDDSGEVISSAADWVYGYDAATGRELWKLSYPELGFSTVPTPVAGHGMVYVCTGFMRPRLLAIRLGGKGELTDDDVAWDSNRQIPKKSSPVLVGDEIYVVSDGGVATCFDAKTGREHWQERMGGNYSASPLAADGRIYFFNHDGQTTVIEPGTEYRPIATNSLDGQFMASAAVAGSALFLRTDTHLYRIEKAGNR